MVNTSVSDIRATTVTRCFKKKKASHFDDDVALQVVREQTRSRTYSAKGEKIG